MFHLWFEIAAFSFHIVPLSQAEALSVLAPSQLAQLTLTTGAVNDTDQIDRVFEQLEEGNSLENVDEFLTQLTANGEVDYFGTRERTNLGFHRSVFSI